MNHTAPDTHQPEKHQSRRRGPRIEVLGQIHGHIVALNIPLLVHDIGPGGFAVESPIAFPRGAIHEFRFSTPNGTKIVVSARAAHCRAIDAPQEEAHFLAGFEFLTDSNGKADRAVEALLDAATSVLMFQ